MPHEKDTQPSGRTVEVMASTYQPSKAELEADVSINATPEEVARALVSTVNIRHIKPANVKTRRKPNKE